MDGSSVSRADAWKRWKTQFMLFLKASGVHKEETGVQASLLINLIGPDGFDVYQTFTYQVDESSENVETIIKKFDAYFGTKPNITLSRYTFFTRNQEEGESINQYVTALKLLSKTCDFSTLEEGLIRDRIVCGVRSAIVRDRMLRTEDLTLERAIKIGMADEVSSDGSRQLERGAGQGPARVDAIGSRGGQTPRRRWRGGRGWRGAGSASGAARGSRAPHGSGNLGQESARWLKVCSGCGSARCQPGACVAATVRCYECQGYGHFARMCSYNNSASRKVHEVEFQQEEPDKDDSCESFYISMIGESSTKTEEWFEVLYCDHGMEKFKLDTGADINVMSYETFKRLNFDRSLIEKENIKLESYTGNLIPIIGVCMLRFYHDKQLCVLRFAIANIKCQSVLGRKSCQDLGLVQRVNSINLSEYSDLFRGLGCLPGVYHIVIDSSVKPVVCAPRKVPFSMRDRLLAELNKMIDLGVIRKVSHPTPWVNALVIAAKKDNGLRICLDPRPLNNAIQRAHFQLPTITDLSTRLRGSCFFSVLDANSGFWMIQIDDESADLCTFSTPFGRYQFTRLPYGINCASEVFHGKMRQLLEDLEGVDSFVDDIIVWGRTRDEHDHRLRLLLQRAKEINLKFNKTKCKIGVEEVTYLGHVFDKHGMRADDNKIRAIKEMQPPNDRKALERFLGAVNFLAKFIPNYSEHAVPLTNLLKKDICWCWEAGHQAAFDKLRSLVCSAPVLALYDPARPVLLSVDSSAYAMGAVLLQDGRPVEYASRTLTDTQARYAQIEKELLAIVFACERFHQYLFGKNKVIVESDHKPLESIFKKPMMSVPIRLQRMLLRLQSYDLVVTYKPGKFMYIPDTLSRSPLSDVYNDEVTNNVIQQVKLMIDSLNISMNKLKLIKDKTRNDVNLMALIKCIQSGWPKYKANVTKELSEYWSYREELFVVDNVIFKGNLVLIPKSLREEMLALVHEGHLGIDRCKRRAREVMFWPGITSDVELYVRRCTTCQENSNVPSREPLIPVEIPSLPWHKISTDIFEYSNKKFVIIVDYYSGYVEVCACNNTTAQTVINNIKEVCARHGIPEVLISDNGPPYNSQEFKKFANEWGFQHVTTSPYYAQANGKVERAVQTVKKLLKKCMQSGNDFQLSLLNYRNTPREGLDSPAQLLMSRRLNCKLPVHPALLIPKTSGTDQHKRMVDKQTKAKMYYDKKGRNLQSLNPGDDVVMIQGKNRSRAKVIRKADTPRSYIVKNKLGIQYRRNRRHLVQCEPPAEPLNDSTEDNHHNGDTTWSDAVEQRDDAFSEYSASSGDEHSDSDNDFVYSPPLTRSRAKLLK